MRSRSGTGVPLRPLAALTIAVLLAHAVALQGHISAIDTRQTHAAGQLVMRLIAPVTNPPGPQAGEVPASSNAPDELTAAPPRQKENLAPEAAPVPLPASTTPTPTPAPAPASTPPPDAAAIPDAKVAQASAAMPAPASGGQDTAPLAATFAIPATARLRYAVNGESHSQSYQANATLLWRHDGASYEARLEINALLVARRQTSVGRITAQGLAPTRFADRGRSEQAAHFERDKDRISFSNNAPSVALLPGAQDRLSVLLQLGAMIGAAPQRFGAGSTIAVQTASTREADTWLFSVSGPEVLALPGGETRALKLVRQPRHEHDQKVELWLAPAMDYLPVRLRLTQPGGDFVDQQWQGTDRG